MKRDYVDLHAILTSGPVTVGDLVSAWNRKYPGKDVGFALRAIAYFADVDKARMPEMLLKTNWENVKADLEKLVTGAFSGRKATARDGGAESGFFTGASFAAEVRFLRKIIGDTQEDFANRLEVDRGDCQTLGELRRGHLGHAGLRDSFTRVLRLRDRSPAVEALVRRYFRPEPVFPMCRGDT